jgi:hypothetical protein
MLSFGEQRVIWRHLDMEPNLELLIALGGIATAIGAIWTAVVTRRLARATERSVAQTGQSLAAQSQHLREQNERARLNLEVDLTYKLAERWNSQLFRNLQKIGYLTRTGVLQPERVWSEYGGAKMAWVLFEPAVKKAREEWRDPALYEDMEYLVHQMVDLDRQRGVESEHPTKEDLRRFVEKNLLAAEAGKEATAGDEDSTKG